jgi:hypothetical protein
MALKVAAAMLDGKPPPCERPEMSRAVLLVPLLLAACAPPDGGSARDNASDPAVADALAGPIMSDAQMGGTAAPDALRPDEQPATLPVPLDARIDTGGAPTLGEVAAKAIADPAFAGCAAEIGYSAMWSVKLPPALALPKDARLAEAAGYDKPGCALRIVRFALPGAPAAALDNYDVLLKREGFAVTADKTSLTAVRAKDGMALRIETALSKDGTRVDLAVRSR